MLTKTIEYNLTTGVYADSNDIHTALEDLKFVQLTDEEGFLRLGDKFFSKGDLINLLGELSNFQKSIDAMK